jgi:hypothetical protein
MFLFTRLQTVAWSDKSRQLNQLVAREINTDKDIASFRAICRNTRDAIDADMGSFWRAKFREKFALRAGTSNMELQTTYQRRMKQLRRGTGYGFFRGHRQREIDVVGVLRELVLGKCCPTPLS